MRCNDVKRRINEKLPLDREMQKHLQDCPACARMVKAAGLVDDAFTTAKESIHDNATPFSDIRNRVETKVITQKENIMSIIKNNLIQRPKLLVGLSLAVLAFLFVTLVPLSYTTTVGYELVYTGLHNGNDISTERLHDAFGALGYDNLTIDFNNNSGVIGGLPNRRAAHEVSIAFSSLTGLTADYEIRPIIGVTSGSLYAQVVNKYKVEVDPTGKSDAEIAEVIRLQLIAGGFSDPAVIVTTGDGQVKLDISGSTVGADGEVQSEAVIELILNGDGDISFETPQGMTAELELDTEGMTDAEVKAAIEAKMAAEGNDGATVEVISQPDGRREIRVKIEKEEIK